METYKQYFDQVMGRKRELGRQDKNQLENSRLQSWAIQLQGLHLWNNTRTEFHQQATQSSIQDENLKCQ